MSRRTLLLAALGLAACSSRPATGPHDGAPRPDSAPVPDAVPGHPHAGAHALAFHRLAANPSTITSPAMTTAATGSTIVVSTGRGDFAAMSTPADSKGNGYLQLDDAHTYTRWSGSGTALYVATDVTGGADHRVTAATPPGDEITLAAVEVRDGTRVQDVAWNEVLDGPLTSGTVTTTGPATLVAFWWGDAGVDDDKTAVPDGGFVVVESILESGALVQGAVAVKNVAEAGTHDVTWTATPTQGAQLWLVAVE